MRFFGLPYGPLCDPSDPQDLSFTCRMMQLPMMASRWACTFAAISQYSGSSVGFCDGNPYALTAAGPVQGYVEPNTGHNVFLGVPYAADTSGQNRWRPPQPVEERTEIFRATKHSATCPQGYTPLASKYTPVGENCLSVNIWSPAQAKKLPVMLYNYGGAMITGSNSDPMYNGTAFASSGVVYVALNHRSNMFGFPYAKALNGTSQNFGILDVFAAVKWVQDNIEAFGGDPENLTFFGQSSGGVMVDYYLWNHPETKLKAAIIQSADVFSGPNYAPEGLAFSLLASDLGCPTDDAHAEIQCMRSKPLNELLTHKFNTTYQTWFTPLIDEHTRYRDYPARYRAGHFPKHVPTLIGDTDDEGTLFGHVVYAGMDSDFKVWMKTFEADAAHIPDTELLMHYDLKDYPSEAGMSGDLYANMRFHCAIDYAVDLRSPQNNVWRYRWRGNYTETGISFLGATHGTENTFIFKYWGKNINEKGVAIPPSDLAAEVADYVHSTWVNFAKNPSPGPGWDPASPRDGPVAQLGLKTSPSQAIVTNSGQFNQICQNFHNLWQPKYPVQMNPLKTS